MTVASSVFSWVGAMDDNLADSSVVSMASWPVESSVDAMASSSAGTHVGPLAVLMVALRAAWKVDRTVGELVGMMAYYAVVGKVDQTVGEMENGTVEWKAGRKALRWDC